MPRIRSGSYKTTGSRTTRRTMPRQGGKVRRSRLSKGGLAMRRTAARRRSY